MCLQIWYDSEVARQLVLAGAGDTFQDQVEVECSPSAIPIVRLDYVVGSYGPTEPAAKQEDGDEVVLQ